MRIFMSGDTGQSLTSLSRSGRNTARISTPILCMMHLIFVLFSSCEGQSVGPAPLGALEYKSYDSLGVLVARGWMRIVADTSRATGEWHIQKVGDPKNIGPQIGDGIFSGLLVQGELHLDLNPQYRDNNVLLSGPYDGETFAGTWMYVGFPGVLNRGLFVAVRRIQ